MIVELRRFVEEHPRTISDAYMKRHNPSLYSFIEASFKEIIENTNKENGKELNYDKLKLNTKVYLILNGYTTIPRCPVCGRFKNDQNVLSFNLGFSKTCSRKCQANDPEIRIKRENTFVEKYGSSNFLASEAGRAAKQQWAESNGVVNPFQLDWIKEKSINTRKARYGHEFTMQSPEKRKLASDNYKKKTGYEHQFLDPEIREKSRKTREENLKNGMDEKEKFRRNSRIRRYRLLCTNDEVVPNFTEEEFVCCDRNTQYTTLFSWHCKKCGNDFDALLDQNFSSRFHVPCRCHRCHPLTNTGISNGESDLRKFLDELNVGYKSCDRDTISPYELDVFVEPNNIAIEYDGLFWHSEKCGKGKYYHLSKTEMCESKDIQLIHIFEDEWLGKPEIVKSRLKNILGIHDKVIYARVCDVRTVPTIESDRFQDENHIQGHVRAKVNYGLYLDGELVSLMTFGKPRFNRGYEWELLRFCNRVGYHVPGAASRLLKHFERDVKPKSVISYADRRWSVGKLYTALGFSRVGVSEPSYYYVKNQTRYSRVRFQKHKLKDILPIYDSSKTEVDNMLDNGYNRIYDCGTIVFGKQYS